MKELGESLKAIFDKLGVFLDLFDLSFFISGATAVSALVFACYQFQTFPAMTPPHWLLVTVFIVATYVAGMVCFAMGRWIRQLTTKQARPEFRSEELRKLLTLHGLNNLEPIKSYLSRETQDTTFLVHEPFWALHNRIWAAIRHNPALSGSLTILNRYWVMAATYDGLVVAFFLWGCVLAAASGYAHGWVADVWPWSRTVLAFLAGCICSCVCLREASRYTFHQLGELAATLAAVQKPSP